MLCFIITYTETWHWSILSFQNTDHTLIHLRNPMDSIAQNTDTAHIVCLDTKVLESQTLNISCTFFGSLANHHVTSKLIQLLQFKQLFIKCSTQKTANIIHFKIHKTAPGKRAEQTGTLLSKSEQTAPHTWLQGKDYRTRICSSLGLELGTSWPPQTGRRNHLKIWESHYLLLFALC